MVSTNAPDEERGAANPMTILEALEAVTPSQTLVMDIQTVSTVTMAMVSLLGPSQTLPSPLTTKTILAPKSLKIMITHSLTMMLTNSTTNTHAFTALKDQISTIPVEQITEQKLITRHLLPTPYHQPTQGQMEFTGPWSGENQ